MDGNTRRENLKPYSRPVMTRRGSASSPEAQHVALLAELRESQHWAKPEPPAVSSDGGAGES